MAIYLQHQKQYIPTLQPFTPDYGFLGDVLTQRQDRYDHNYELLNDAYGRLISTPLSREGNIQIRDQYANNLSNKLKQVSGMDLSLGKNVEAAKALFKPFYDNQQIIQDMVFTTQGQKEMQKMQTYMHSDDEKLYSKFWDIGAEDLQYKLNKFATASAEEAYSMAPPRYVENADIYGRAQAIFEKYPLSIKHTTVDGDWKIEMENGALLLEETIGQDAQGNPIKRSPAMSHLYEMLMRDPQVGLALKTEAEVMSRRFANDPKNQQEFGGYDGALKQWANTTIGKSVPKQTKDLAISDNYIATLKNNLVSWNRYRKKHGITPAEQQLHDQQVLELELLESTRKMQKENLVNSVKPANELGTLLNSAYTSYMNSVLNDRMKKAAIKYADTSAVYKRTESELGKAKIKYKYDKLIDDHKTRNQMDLETWKHQLNNGMIDQTGSAAGDAPQVSWDKRGVDIQKEIFKNNGYFVTNQEAFDRYNNAYNKMQWDYIEDFVLNNGHLIEELTDGKNGRIKYIIEKGNGETEEVVTDLETAKKYLLKNGGMGSQLDAIYDKLVNIRREKIPILHGNPESKIPNPHAVNYQNWEDNIAIYNTMLGQASLEDAKATNAISKYIYQNAWEKEKNLGIPPIAMTEGEYALLNRGFLVTDPGEGAMNYTIDDFLNGRIPENKINPIQNKDFRNEDMKFLNIKEYEDMFVNMARGDEEFQEYLKQKYYIDVSNPYNSFESTKIEARHPELKDGTLRGMYYKMVNGKYVFNEDKARKDAQNYYKEWKEKINEVALSSFAGPGGSVVPFNMNAFMSGVNQTEESPGGVAYPSYTFDYDHMNKAKSKTADTQLNHLLRLTNTHGDDIVILEGDQSDKGPAWFSLRKKKNWAKKQSEGDARTIYNQIQTLKRMSANNHKGLKLTVTHHEFGGSSRLNDGLDSDQMYSAYVINTLPVSADATGITDEVQLGGQTITLLVPKKYDQNPYKYETQIADAYKVYLNNFKEMPGSVPGGGSYNIIKDSNNQLWSYVTFQSWDDSNGTYANDDVISTNLSNHGLHDRSLNEIISMINEKLYQRQLENWNARNAWCVKTGNCNKN